MHAWSEQRTSISTNFMRRFISLTEVLSSKGPFEGTRRFDLVSWSGSVIHSLTLSARPFQSLEATPYVYVSEEAAMIFYEWDNIYGGELFLYSWTGEELQRSISCT